METWVSLFGEGLTYGVTELDLGLEQAGTGAADPGDDRFVDLALFQGFNKGVLIFSTELTEHDHHLHL